VAFLSLEYRGLIEEDSELDVQMVSVSEDLVLPATSMQFGFREFGKGYMTIDEAHEQCQIVLDD